MTLAMTIEEDSQERTFTAVIDLGGGKTRTCGHMHWSPDRAETCGKRIANAIRRARGR